MKSAEREKKFKEGLAHFNAGRFFEAHEFWEEIWLREPEPEPEKTFLQGLIQITAAFHHYQRGNPDGAESLLASGIVKLLRFPADHHGLAIGAIRESAKRWVRALGSSSDLGYNAIPKLEKASPDKAKRKRVAVKKRSARQASR